MRHILLSLSLLLSLTACGEDKKQAEINKAIQAQNAILLEKLKAKEALLQQSRAEAKRVKEELLTKEHANKKAFLKMQAQKEKMENEKVKNEKLSQIGISVHENTISIDTNKTKDFFKNIGKKLEDKLKKITQNMEKGLIEEKSAGVKIDESHINIDLNKTKSFLDTWGEKMQTFVKEFDSMTKEISPQIEQSQLPQTKGK